MSNWSKDFFNSHLKSPLVIFLKQNRKNQRIGKKTIGHTPGTKYFLRSSVECDLMKIFSDDLHEIFVRISTLIFFRRSFEDF